MEALELIKDHITEESLYELLTQLGFKSVHKHGDVLRAKCAIHGGDNSSAFVFSVEKGLYFCHSCGAFGDTVQLVETLLEMEFVSAVRYVLQFLGISEEGVEIKRRSSKLKKDLKAWTELFSKEDKTVHAYTYPNVPLKDVTGFRSFKPETLSKKKLQFAPSYPFETLEGKQIEIKDRLIMPIVFDNETVAVAMRKTRKQDDVKWLFQPTRFNKRNIVYNLQHKWYNEIVLVEGIFDEWAFDEIEVDYAGALLGLSITDEQLTFLQLCTQNITLALDGDLRGKKGVYDNIQKLKNMFNLSIVQFNDEEDPCSVPREVLKERYLNKLHYSKWLKENEKEIKLCLTKNKN